MKLTREQRERLNATLENISEDEFEALAREGARIKAQSFSRESRQRREKMFLARQALAAREATEHNNSASVHGREEP